MDATTKISMRCAHCGAITEIPRGGDWSALADEHSRTCEQIPPRRIADLTAKLAAAEARAERASLLPALVEACNAMATLLEMDDDMAAYMAAEVWKQLAAGLAPADEPAGPAKGGGDGE
jgi:hypothetical protein